MLALQLHSSSTWFASPLFFFSPPIFSSACRKCYHLSFFKEQYTTDRQQKVQETSQASKPRFPPEKEKKTSTSVFQSGGYAPYPPGSNCLFSSLAGSLSSGLRHIFLQAIFDEAKYVGGWLSVCIRIPSSSREKCFPRIRTHADEQTAVDSGSSHLLVRETLLSGCLKACAS